jgi:hemimethylated DNA binding protein
MSLVPIIFRAIARGALGVRSIKEANHRLVPSGCVHLDFIEQSAHLQKEMEWGKLLEEGESNAQVLKKVRKFFEVEAGETDEQISARIDEAFDTMRIMSEYEKVVENMVDEGQFEPRVRPKGLKFRVGDVIQHKFFGKGVIYGWDETCKMGEDWCQQNKIDEILKHGRNQPFYNLLLTDESRRYCSEENVQVDEEPDYLEIDHPDIPHLFPGGLVGQERFDATREKGKETHWVYIYEASPELAGRYPEDLERGFPAEQDEARAADE